MRFNYVPLAIGILAASGQVDPAAAAAYEFAGELSLAGAAMTMWRVDREEALRELTGEDVDLAVATLVKTGPIEVVYYAMDFWF